MKKQQWIERLNDLASQAKSLFPIDETLRNGMTRHEQIDNEMANTISRYDPETASTVVNMFHSKMNTFARIAYRKNYQSEIIEIK